MKQRFPKPSRYIPKNPEKYVGDILNIISRSSYERKFMVWCDFNPSVIKWGSEIYPIEYFSTAQQKTRRYFIDFFVRMKTKSGEIKNLAIELKPRYQTLPPKKTRNQERYIQECITYQVNMDKWKAATQWAEQNNFQFIVMDEYALGIAK